MLKNNLTDGIKIVLYEGGALFIFLAVSVGPRPFLSAALIALSLFVVLAAVMGLGNKFRKNQFLVLSVAVSGAVFGMASNFINYRNSDFIFLISLLSVLYLVFLLTRGFTKKIEPGNIAGALAAFTLTSFSIAFISATLVYNNINVAAAGGMLITAAVIIFYRIILRAVK
ncbi:MAG: hypothetical protein PF545_01960 [Elusimicrobia bacterium]|jgi:uncharacterized membrane protein (UPF0136 family)|nr:hypothetical protein [Elusimicrobiota bacterium]